MTNKAEIFWLWSCKNTGTCPNRRWKGAGTTTETPKPALLHLGGTLFIAASAAACLVTSIMHVKHGTAASAAAANMGQMQGGENGRENC